MKKLYLILTLLPAIPFIGFTQNDTIIKEGTVNFATLVLDFESYEFEGGNMAYYECPGCTSDSLPFMVDFMPPGDFGGITFKLDPSETTFFDATIVWAGMGQLQYPTSFDTEYPFNYTDNAVDIPTDIKYLEMNGEEMPEDSWLFEMTDSVWTAIDSLAITNLFATNNFKAVVYFYPPSVGVIDPSVAKWIVFLYYTDFTNPVTNVSENDNITLFPNPTSNKIVLETDSKQLNSLRYRIGDLNGLILKEGIIDSSQKQIELSFLPKGVYTITVMDEEGKYFKTKRIIKETGKE